VAELEEELAAAESSIESLKELLYCRNRAVLRAGGQIAELANSVESLNKELETERARASALEQELRASKGG
jgi:chromosome segregation ATPase